MPVDVDKRHLKQEKRKKRPQNRKGTALQDRKPSDNYSAPYTYHKKKKKKTQLWPHFLLCLQSLSGEPRFPDSPGWNKVFQCLCWKSVREGQMRACTYTASRANKASLPTLAMDEESSEADLPLLKKCYQ